MDNEIHFLSPVYSSILYSVFLYSVFFPVSILRSPVFEKCVNHVTYMKNYVSHYTKYRLTFSKIVFMKKWGILIIIIGLAFTALTAFIFFSNEKVITIGKIEVIRNIPHYLKWSPLGGIAVMVVGWVLYGQTSKKQQSN